jgi:alpha-1,2-glucosyltransferase
LDASLNTLEGTVALRELRGRLPGLLTLFAIVCASLGTLVAVSDMPSYSDEVYHVPQIQTFCDGHRELDSAITMLPGYHVLSAALATLTGDCSQHALRRLNMLWGLAATLIAFLILRASGSRAILSRTLSFHFLPVLFPYHFLVFTDIVALVPALLAVYCMLRKSWVAAGIIGTLSIGFRQTNVAVLLFLGMVCLAQHVRVRPLLDSVVACAKQTWSCTLGLCGFALFVKLNHGVALGDRSSHAIGVHLGNVFFAVFLAVLVALPIHVAQLRERARALRAAWLLAALPAVYVVYMLTFKVDHPYNAIPNFVRNQLLMWAARGPLNKTLFFLPVALGLSSLWLTRFSRGAFWVLYPLAFLTLIPESLIEQRYAMLSVSLWMLLRRDTSPTAESLTALLNAAISGVLLWLISSTEWSL